MKIEYLEEFLALSESLNYGVTAEDYYISTSTLSRHIALLEEELKEELFRREGRSVALSEAGSVLIPYARQIVSSKNECVSTFSRMRDALHQTLTIGFSGCIVQYGLMDLIFEYRRQHPQVNVLMAENNTTALLQKVSGHLLNFAICYDYGLPESRGLEERVLLRDRLAVAIAETNPLSSASGVTLQQLKNETFVLRREGGASHRYLWSMFEEALFHPTVAAYSESGDTLLNYVAQGVGVSVVEKERFLHAVPPGVRLIDLSPEREKCLSLFFCRRVYDYTEKQFLAFLKDNLGKYVPTAGI